MVADDRKNHDEAELAEAIASLELQAIDRCVFPAAFGIAADAKSQCDKRRGIFLGKNRYGQLRQVDVFATVNHLFAWRVRDPPRRQ